ncbi:hypothetical protein BU23DRAFT_113939 [Bimuria novae-zelandiae CBS 107.79]|uniref:Uncharacterized protein n=1 Tax=Bimuria novae-zelandiae CBS 107.79 TaxID=1447943 RepID=A0A6A5VA51_9PLEO|nr:hypothetical protein BU23DRAFT_113939 [Bimuria novae-zelandiae CBS 107.79]
MNSVRVSTFYPVWHGLSVRGVAMMAVPKCWTLCATFNPALPKNHTAKPHHLQNRRPHRMLRRDLVALQSCISISTSTLHLPGRPALNSECLASDPLSSTCGRRPRGGDPAGANNLESLIRPEHFCARMRLMPRGIESGLMIHRVGESNSSGGRG